MIISRELIRNFFSQRDAKHALPWDVVVLTAFNEKQARFFESQLKAKGLPADRFLVVPDPEGVKLGNGGSTIHVLRTLRRSYGEQFDQMKILIIHAGGFSKRLPVISAKGKIFLTLPTEFGPLTMLDLKLILLAPFGEQMSSGVFVTCADDLEPYELSDRAALCFGRDFTVFAHITTDLHVATQHGVYKVDRHEDLLNPARGLECLRVLQKPSLDVLRSTNATFENNGKESALIDSMYCFSPKVALKLLNWADVVDFETDPFEVDGYGDFLQPLGREATGDYMSSKDRLKARSELHSALKACRVNVTVLEKSYFVHLGTTQEYISHLTSPSDFRRDLLLSASCNSTFSGARRDSCCLISSEISGNVRIGESCVIEFSQLSGEIEVGAGCIVSHCRILAESGPLAIPMNSVWQTLPVRSEQGRRFVTFAVGLCDDLKREVDDLGDLRFCGSDIRTFLEHHRLSAPETFPVDAPRSLWTARLFPSRPTREASFLATHVALLKNNVLTDMQDCLYSINEIIEGCDIDAINRSQ